MARFTKKRATIHLHTIETTDKLSSGAVQYLNGITFDQWLRLGQMNDDIKAKALKILRDANPLKPQWAKELERAA